MLAIDLGAGEDEADPLRDLGATGHTPIGFVASHEMPDMVGLPPDRNNGWGDEDHGQATAPHS